MPVERQGGVSLSYVCLHCHRFLHEGYSWWVSTGCTAASTIGGARLVVQDSAEPSEAKVFRAHAPPQDACENLVCALKLFAKQQTDKDSLVDTIFEGL